MPKMPKNSKFKARNSATNKSVTGSDALHVRLVSSRFSLNWRLLYKPPCIRGRQPKTSNPKLNKQTNNAKNSKLEARNSSTQNSVTGSDALHFRQGSSCFSFELGITLQTSKYVSKTAKESKSQIKQTNKQCQKLQQLWYLNCQI